MDTKYSSDQPIPQMAQKTTLLATVPSSICSFFFLLFLLLNYDGQMDVNIPRFLTLEFLGFPGPGMLR